MLAQDSLIIIGNKLEKSEDIKIAKENTLSLNMKPLDLSEYKKLSFMLNSESRDFANIYIIAKKTKQPDGLLKLIS